MISAASQANRHEEVQVRSEKASARFCERIPIEFARDHLVISQGLHENGREILVVADDRSDRECIVHNIAARLGRACVIESADGAAIARALEQLAERMQMSANGTVRRDQAVAIDENLDDGDLAELLAADERDLLSTAGRAPVVRLVNGILFEALNQRSSDVHVQPTHEGVVVRYRVDGVLRDGRHLPAKLRQPIVSRVKVMARMDIAERRLPQDGRANVRIGSREIDLRISTIPTALGERMVIRLLDKGTTASFDLERLGMPRRMRERFAELCARPHGMILVTGPTGSGKTTTLYSVLRRLDSDELNILTLEDPIEYELAGISQSQINLKKGITFATGLRHVLRQDPDVIMVGEIRDAETARIAIQSALTGHMVYSTLHTNGAASAVTRLVDLGVEPYLINASLSAVLAQRLIRTICGSCDGRAEPGRPACNQCAGSGFFGRTGLYELLTMNPVIRDLVASGDRGTVLAIHESARSSGMTTLREAGLAAVSMGLTTRSEVDRVTLGDDVEEEVLETADEVLAAQQRGSAE